MKTLTVADIREPLFCLLPEIFRECVDKEDGRYSLSAPFALESWVIATDGKILVRAPISAGVAEILARVPGRKLPKVENQFRDHEYYPEPVAPFVVPPKTQCKHCDGTKKEFCDCCEHYHPCDWCEGTGLAWPDKLRVKLSDDFDIAPGYAEILLRHGAKLFLPVQTTLIPIRFTTEDTDGLLMPLDPNRGRD